MPVLILAGCTQALLPTQQKQQEKERLKTLSEETLLRGDTEEVEEAVVLVSCPGQGALPR